MRDLPSLHAFGYKNAKELLFMNKIKLMLDKMNISRENAANNVNSFNNK